MNIKSSKQISKRKRKKIPNILMITKGDGKHVTK